jgi:membrane protein DedA with SNARE-associated domain
MVGSLGAWIGDVFGWLGALGEDLGNLAGNWWFLAVVAAVAIADSVVPVLPSETTVILAGVAIATGVAPYPLWLLMVVAAAGAFIGDNIAYQIGREFAGRLERRAERRPKFARKLDVARRQIERRGGILLITVRFLPGGRTVVTLSCGATRQPRRWFMAWDLLAVVIWATYSAGLAYLIGKPLEDHKSLAFWAAFATALAVNVVIEAVRKARDRRRRGAVRRETAEVAKR